jgi:predicted DNA-binding mobile mystery protein A
MLSTAGLRRKQLDRAFQSLSSLRTLSVPPGGWLRAIRQSLGMSASQLAARVDLDPSTIRAAEGREAAGSITLETLARLAASLDCDVKYVLLPRRGTLEATLRARALAVAELLVGSVQHTMSLEAQAIDAEQRQEQVRELAEELIRTQSPELWSPEILA